MKYTLDFTHESLRDIKKLTAKNPGLKKRIKKAFELLSTNPYHQGLRTHKVNSKSHGVKNSSRITGDLRILWEFSINGELVIIIVALGGHSGGNSVY